MMQPAEHVLFYIDHILVVCCAFGRQLCHGTKSAFCVCVCACLFSRVAGKKIFIDICDICVSVCLSKGDTLPITPALLLPVAK